MCHIPVEGVGHRHLDPERLTVHVHPRRSGKKAGFDGRFAVVVEFGPVGSEELDPVVGGRVVARRDHHAERGVRGSGQVTHRPDRDDPEIGAVEPGRIESGVDRRSEHLSGAPGVTAHDRGAAATVGGGVSESERHLCGEVDVGETSYPIRAEQLLHIRSLRRVTPGTRASARRRAPLALGVLRSAAGLAESVLLALDGSGVALEESRLLQTRTMVGIDLDQRTGDPQAKTVDLTGHPATLEKRLDVVHALDTSHPHRFEHAHPVRWSRKVSLDRLAVERHLPGALAESNAYDGSLATADGHRERLGHRVSTFRAVRVSGWGAWPACG